MTLLEGRGPVPGDPAPDFTLPSTAGHDVTLSAFRGQSNVLLAFFPLAFTRVCTAEMGDFTLDFTKFEAVNARVFGISVDSVPTLKEFRAKHDMRVDLLSDFKRDVSRRYGTLLEKEFFSKRAYFIVDREGLIRWSFVERELGSKRVNDELLAQLAALR